MKELIPKDEYGIFADKPTNETIAPKQWIYVIEKEKDRVKVGVSVMPEERMKVLERSGEFKISRKQLLEPAVVVAEEVAESIGDINPKSDVPNMDALVSFLCPQHDELCEFKEALNDAGLTIFQDKKGKIWFESEELGIFTAEFFNAFMKINKIRGGEIICSM